MFFGGYPGAWRILIDSGDDEERWQNYVRDALIETVRKFEATRKNRSLWGRLVENMVGAALVNNNAGKGVEVSYWRERDAEIDFVVRRGEKILGIEVKTGLDPQQKKEGRRSFLKKFPEAKILSTQLAGGDISIEKFVNLSVDEILSASS